MNRFALPALTLSSCLALLGCGRAEEDLDRESTASSALETNDETVEQAQYHAQYLLGTTGSNSRAAWDHLPEGDSWNRSVLGRVHAKQKTFELARDLDDFCPGYANANSAQKDTCWLRIVSAIARYESNFNPRATYLEHTGRTSVGLLMMNPDHCPGAHTVEALKDATLNINCAMDRMRLLISRDHSLSGAAPKRGAAAYWSVLRPPYTFRGLELGKKAHIQAFTRSYLAYSSH